MRIYFRDKVELYLIEKAREFKDANALALRQTVFQAVPGNVIGVMERSISYLSIVFLAHSTHPDEPIPHFRNLDGIYSNALVEALVTLPSRPGPDYIPVDIFKGFKEYTDREARNLLVSLEGGINDRNASHVLIFKGAGLLLVNQDGIVGKLQNVQLSKMLHKIYEEGK